jgi:hypothetical protein
MQQFILIILFLVTAVNFSTGNELPVLTYTKQPVVDFKNEQDVIIIKFKKEEKKEEVSREPFTINNNLKRSYRSCTSLG